MNDFLINLVILLIFIIYLYYADKRFKKSKKILEKKPIRDKWISAMIILIIISGILMLLNGMLNYLENVFWNIILGIIISFIAIAILYSQRREKVEKEQIGIISRKSLVLLSILLVLFLSNFSEITNKIQFISKGDSITLADLEKGDILFRHEGLGDSLLPGYWSHIGLFAGKINGSFQIIQSTTLKGVHLVSLSNFVGNSRVSVAKVKNTTPESRDFVVDWAKQKIGLHYNFFLVSKKEDANSYYCSELIWASYKKIGIDLDKNPGFSVKFAYSVAPQEMFGDEDIIIFHINNTVKSMIVNQSETIY